MPKTSSSPRAAWLLPIVLAHLAALILLAPASIGYHFSVGADDGVGVAPSESPDDPSVSSRAHAVGTSTDCEQVRPRVDVGELERAAFGDAFCGELVYHEGTSFETASTPDQDLWGSVGTFDVVPANRLEGLEPCLPWCPSLPGSQAAWTAVHRAGSALDLTDDPESADEQAPEDRRQHAGGTARAGTPGHVVQDNAGAWRTNGWMAPSASRTFVAFVHDDQGAAMGPQDIREAVETAGQTGRSAPHVCGFSPSVDFRSTATAGGCEIVFEFRSSVSSSGTDFRDGYREPCRSPTYVCGAFSGASWHADVSCLGCGGHEQVDYFVWHWTVAAAPSDCGGMQEPGFAFEVDEDEPPYLAHDLDVYTPASTTSLGPHVSATGLGEYAEGMGDRARDGDGELDPGLPPLPEGSDEAVEQALGEARNTTYLAFKEHRVEPNAKPAGALGDTSQSIEVEREGLCAKLEAPETEASLDPWVNVVDGGALGPGAGAYGNEETHQDEHNNPTPGVYTTAGKVGMFADKNDDGTYDQLGPDRKYQGAHAFEEGAYPMLWDVPVEEDGQAIDADAGCQVEGIPMGAIAGDAGYGPATGLVQAVYLREPTTFTSASTGDTLPYADGNNVYVLASPAAHAVWAPGGSGDHPLAERVQALVDELREFAVTQQGADPASLDVHAPGAELGLASDFQDQCSEDTGGFGSRLSFTHDCETNCSGDTVVTMYVFEVARRDGTLGGGTVPVFAVDDETHAFGSGVHAWYDVDPFDGDPDRNLEEDNAPPTEE